ncbi:uncharacterized protein Gasu_30860 [Galdieria sulphuraria]|uniref:Uncharacterized protein n=1 Tax=Galdieria sulphuraria TaxID=130081 RepID=M2XH91_GALSU|nr:uncharacterized protein Gasu_30860 [Galdieria sulphuraria]EME29442.1 hypothetical protein Gasu_30860 [Galdieria sulphuraria]|eukprot:XP_005705962.1 hypothetical protein Gasu_30860 [Galdieria sulphuraria]
MSNKSISIFSYVLNTLDDSKFLKAVDSDKCSFLLAWSPVFSQRLYISCVGRTLSHNLVVKRRKFSVSCMKTSESGDRSSFYKRPSKALRRGGGFFVPGLEGPVLERVIGGILLFAFLMNSFTIEDWTLSLKLSLSSGILAIFLWLYLQFRHKPVESSTARKVTRTVPTKTLRKAPNISFSSSMENELNSLLEVLDTFYRVEYLAIYREVEPHTTVPVYLTVGILVEDLVKLLYKNVDKALHFSTSPPWQPELLCFLPNDLTTDAVSLWLYPFICPSVDKLFTVVVCYEGTQRLSPENGKWLIGWIKNRLIPYLDSFQSSGNF